jgi:hypothetical protein
MMAAAGLVTITGRVAACRDPDDNKLLELAVPICSCSVPRHPDRHSGRVWPRRGVR